ncbi:glycosyltransferase family 2 protein [Trueperella pyogenes]|uniref:glycosyltransferase family 2 protein n=1 Tax=Trueperella pyogenes TaxID=1661 RepID=UPI003133394F
MTFISIVIPVYNAQKYLSHCVDSVKEQTFQDWEIILVDDGSTDSSPELCDQLALSDSRITVIHQPNAGTSAARNTGLGAATGAYVTFMDNDDWWTRSDCLDIVYASLTSQPVDFLCHMNCDASFDGVITNDQPTKYADAVAAMPPREAFHFLIDRGLLASAVWAKIVRRDLIVDHQIFFPSGMRNEDTEWSAKLLAVSASVGWIDERFYAYRQGHSYAQTSHRLSADSVDDLERILLDNFDLAASLPPQAADTLRAFLAYPFVVWMGQASALGLFDSRQRIDTLIRLTALLARVERPEVKLARWTSKVLGIRATAWLLGRTFRRKHPNHAV